MKFRTVFVGRKHDVDVVFHEQIFKFVEQILRVFAAISVGIGAIKRSVAVDDDPRSIFSVRGGLLEVLFHPIKLFSKKGNGVS